jgi:hypothetical protein
LSKSLKIFKYWFPNLIFQALNYIFGKQEMPNAHGSRVEPIENSQSLRLLYRSLQCLSTKDRSLLLEYYSPRRDRVIARRQLAQEHGITVRALRLRVTRLKFKLKLHIGEHLAYIEVGPKD